MGQQQIVVQFAIVYSLIDAVGKIENLMEMSKMFKTDDQRAVKFNIICQAKKNLKDLGSQFKHACYGDGLSKGYSST